MQYFRYEYARASFVLFETLCLAMNCLTSSGLSMSVLRSISFKNFSMFLIVSLLLLSFSSWSKTFKILGLIGSWLGLK